MASFEMTIKPARIEALQREWLKLNAEQYDVDFKKSAFAFELRRIFPRSPAGDTQFKQFVAMELTNPRCRADAMLEKALAYELFDEHDWKRLGGWPSVSFLGALTVSQRKHVLSLLKKDQYHYHSIRTIARKAGIVSARKMGRPSTSQTEQKNDVLSKHIADIYQRLANGLPIGPMPVEVRAALPARTLSSLGTVIAARA